MKRKLALVIAVLCVAYLWVANKPAQFRAEYIALLHYLNSVNDKITVDVIVDGSCLGSIPENQKFCHEVQQQMEEAGVYRLLYSNQKTEYLDLVVSTSPISGSRSFVFSENGETEETQVDNLEKGIKEAKKTSSSSIHLCGKLDQKDWFECYNYDS